jgi:hypothetical protein
LSVVIPAQAGIQAKGTVHLLLYTGLRRYDGELG